MLRVTRSNVADSSLPFSNPAIARNADPPAWPANEIASSRCPGEEVSFAQAAQAAQAGLTGPGQTPGELARRRRSRGLTR